MEHNVKIPRKVQLGFQNGQRNFRFSTASGLVLPPSRTYSRVTEIILLYIKRLKCEADHTSRSNLQR
jgi:hypothetical protein